MAARGSRHNSGSERQNMAKADEGAIQSLQDEVKEAMRAVLRDPAASAAAKASAGRTLMEFFAEAPGGARRSTELTVEELDDEIARLTRSL
jgi:hypothetical protein